MTSQRWMLAFCFALASVLGTGESVTTTEAQKYTCRTFGSGVVQPFNGSSYYVRSNCPFTLTRFTHNRVECDITVRRGDNGLLVQVEIIINKVRTVVQGENILVEKKSVSLPYDHTYQHIFQYGIYTKLKSSLIPLSVTWHNVPGGIDTVWVELEQELSTDMIGLCGKHNVSGKGQQLIKENALAEDTCQTRDPVSTVNRVCRLFFSYTLDCLRDTTLYIQLCEENMYGYETSKHIGCAFFKEVVQHCGNESYVWKIWRSLTECAKPSCPGDLVYVEQGPPFVPSCSNLNPTFSSQELTSSCVCTKGEVLNDHTDGFHCVSVSRCPCVFAGKSYSTGEIRSTKCQSCMCDSGKWRCSENLCPARCLIEGQFVTTFDGKQYVVPGKCTYVASQGLNWTVTIEFSAKEPSLTTVILQVFEDSYTFSHNMVKLGGEDITELHQSDHALVFWQSSLYVQVHTSFGMKLQVQVSPEIQLYITPPRNHNGMISGLCGNSNNDTTDDFTTSSGIIENSAQPFAQSWSVAACPVNIPNTCINTDNEIFADEKCSVLNNPTGIFAKCHSHIPTDHYHTACIQRTCNCGNSPPQCLCVALGSYAKACASLGVVIGDWRKATNCTLTCQNNQEFSYNMQACNHTCRSLSGPDPSCGLDDAPVEGCGCPEGTHLNQGHICTPKSECVCHYYGGITAPGSIIIDGRKCICENGQLHCSQDCGCRNGKVCFHCSEFPVNTAQKTCDSLSKPMVTSMSCESGCYCPHGQYEDHHGNCVPLDNCTCAYSGKIFSAGQHVKSNCKTCICGQGQWRCRDEPCPGKCQVYGNGHYQTFDTKWYRFDGQCQYTLVEDDCGSREGTFSVRVESVPCCDEALTCSRSIILDLQGKVTLTLSDMKVTRRHHEGWTLQEEPLYSTHTVGLYIIISVPSRGITLIWDKHTRITIELHAYWRNRVCGLCGNFDSNEMNDLQISGSAVLSSPLAFGNSWKAATPPCSDVTTEIFPCERNSYCSAWAQRRCMILTGDTFSDCHLKVDPDPYYHACVQESCSCEFEGKFLGFCTAVAAYAEACSDQDVCVKWRTPDLCPVYCDYYNEQGQCSWHYEACGEMLSCGKDNYITGKLEGCYPRCSKEAPYYDENTGECTKLRNCTCYFNDTIIQPQAVVMIESIECRCENGTMNCHRVFKTPDLYSTSAPTAPPPTTTPATTPTSGTPTTAASTTTETVYSTTSTPATTTTTTAETLSTITPTTSTPMTTITNVSTTTESWSTVPSSTSTPTSTTSLTTAQTSTTPTSTSTLMTTIPNVSTTTESWSTVPSSTSTPTSTTSLTTAQTSSTTPPTSFPPMPTITNVSTTTENWSTVLPTTSTPTTTSTLTTTETLLTTASTTSTPMTTIINDSATTENWSTVLSTTATSTTTTTSTTAETSTAIPPTTSTPMTTIPNVSATTEHWSTVVSTTTTSTTTTSLTPNETSTMPTSTSTPMTTIINDSTTTENWSTVLSTTATPTTTTTLTTAETSTTIPPTTSTPITTITNVSATTENWSTGLSTTTTPTTTTSLISTETSSTTPPTTSTPMTTIPNVSATTEHWSTVVSTTTTSTTTTSLTPNETSTTPTSTSTPKTTIINDSTTTENWSTVLSTTSTPTTTTTLTTAETSTTIPPTTSTPITAITNDSTTTENWSTVLSTSITPTTTTSLISTETSSTTPPTTSTPMTTITNISATTENWSTALSTASTPTTTTTSATSAETSGPTEVTISEAPTETFTSSTHSTTQPTTTFSEATTSHGVTSKSTMMPPTTYTTEVSTSEGFTNATSTTELITPEESATTMMTEKTYPTVVTGPPETVTTVSVTTANLVTESSSTPKRCECTDLKRRKRWDCGETWTEDCFHKNCTDGKIELTSVVCPEPIIPTCPRDQVTKVSDGCCETWKCDCRCELYGDPHYISFQGVTFDFLDECTYILMEERSPRHHLTIAVDNVDCVPGLQGSCAKGIILKYRDNIATLHILPRLFGVQATLNNVTIEPPYEEQGFRFETTRYIVSIYLPEIRSYVSLSPSYTLVVSLAMEYFLNNTQGQCGVCGVGSCIRKGGQIEDDSCCDKTAYDWVYTNPLKPACASALTDVPCHSPTTVPPYTSTATPCPVSPLCELLHHPVFSNCSGYVNLTLKKKNCEFDSCRNGPCSSLEQAAEECMKAGVCIDWRALTNGGCNVTCPDGLVYRECRDKLDDFCSGGLRYQGASLESTREGCFCPSGHFRAGNHSHICVSDCSYCKGPLGEPRMPGEVWRSGCYLCTCNNKTHTEDCVRKPPEPAPLCSPNAVLVNTSCCDDQICVDKTCSYHGQTYMVGDRWKDAAQPCVSFSCSQEGIQTETRVCPREDCQEEDRIWDNQHCCFTCNQSCAPKVTAINVTIENCTAVMQIPVCQGQCVSQSSVTLHGDLQVKQKTSCCQALRSERRPVTLQCFDFSARHYYYKHITRCECTACRILR